MSEMFCVVCRAVDFLCEHEFPDEVPLHEHRYCEITGAPVGDCDCAGCFAPAPAPSKPRRHRWLTGPFFDGWLLSVCETCGLERQARRDERRFWFPLDDFWHPTCPPCPTPQPCEPRQ